MNSQLNATRIELSKLKNQLAISIRGHKLLKDKQDEMIRQLLEILRENKNFRRNLESKLIDLFNEFGYVEASHNDVELYEKTLIPSSKLEFVFGKKNIMGVSVPKINVNLDKPELTYSLLDTDSSLDNIIFDFNSSISKIVELAVYEKTISLLLKEIEKVKRRVNAIEHIMIPELQENIKKISAKLADNELNNTIRTMKSKEIVLKKGNVNDGANV